MGLLGDQAALFDNGAANSAAALSPRRCSRAVPLENALVSSGLFATSARPTLWRTRNRRLMETRVGARGIRVVMSTHDLSKARRLVVDIVSIPPRRLQILACTRTRFWLAVEYRLADPNSVDWRSNINS